MKMIAINMTAKTIFNFPNSNKSGAKKNSNMFMIPMTRICNIEQILAFILVKIQKNIPTSNNPIITVKPGATLSPKILATIS